MYFWDNLWDGKMYFWDNSWDEKVSEAGRLVKLGKVDGKTDKAR